MKKIMALLLLLVDCAAVAKALDMGPRELCRIYIGIKSESLVYCHDKWIPIDRLKDAVKEYVSGVRGKAFCSDVGMLSERYAVIALQTERGARYKTYFAVQNELSKAYNELRDELAHALWSCSYSRLKPHQQRIVRRAYPMVVSDVEPRRSSAALPSYAG